MVKTRLDVSGIYADFDLAGLLGEGDFKQYGSRLVRSDTVAEPGDPSTTGGRRGVLGAFVRGHKPVRNTCESGHDHAEGYSAGETNKRGLGWFGMMALRAWAVCCLDFDALREAKVSGVGFALVG